MAFDSKKTILLEKKYLYVRASLGFQLEGVSTEKIPTNNGFYRFYVDNLSKALGNSYVAILYDSQDLTLQCFCSDLYMDELMSSDSSAIEDVVEEMKKNTTTIIEFENGVSSALASNHEDNVLLHADNELINTNLSTNISPKLKNLPSYLDCLLRSIGVYSNVFCFQNDNRNIYLSVPLSFSDFKKYFYHDGSFFESFKNYTIASSGYLNFYFSFDVPSYFSDISSIFDSFVCQVYGKALSNIQSSPTINDIAVNTGKRFLDITNFFDSARTASDMSGNYFLNLAMRFRLSENLYKFLCLCSHEKNNFFSVPSTSMDEFYLTRGDGMPCCSLNQKLNIYKRFDSVQNYEFSVFFDFPFDEATFKKFHFYFLVNNNFVEVVPSFVNKNLRDLLNCNFVFSGSSSYYIESMSVFPF